VSVGQRAVGKVTLVREALVMVDFGVEVDGMLRIEDVLQIDARTSGLKADKIFKIGDMIHIEVKEVDTKRDRIFLREARPEEGRKKKHKKSALAGTTAKAMAKRPAPQSADVQDEVAVEDSFGDAIDDTLSDEEKSFLERDVLAKLQETMPSDNKEDLAELAEFVVCMLRTKKKPSEVHAELEGFLRSATATFVSWLVDHLKNPSWLL